MTTHNSQNDPSRRRDQRFFALALGAVFSLFTGVVLGVLIATSISQKEGLPDAPQLEALRTLLGKGAQTEEIKEAIRSLDVVLRKEYFSAQARIKIGAWLLLAGVAGLIACGRWYSSLDPAPVVPITLAERYDEDRWNRRRRVRLAAAASTTAALIAGLWGIGLWQQKAAQHQPAPTPAPSVQPAPLPAPPVQEGRREIPLRTSTVFKDNWPGFRGTDGMGNAPDGIWPETWDAATGQNIAWKTRVPLPGKSSPIVWADRIFLTGFDQRALAVMCFDRTTGSLVWKKDIPSSVPRPRVLEMTGYAAPTPVTDGRRVFVFFATADLAALDFSGNILWQKNLGAPENPYGIATSPVLAGGLLVLQYDRGYAPSDNLSALIAFDPANGREVWRTPRPVGSSWSTPLLCPCGRQLITAAEPWLISYDPKTGKELWRADGIGADHAASPVMAGTLVFVSNANSKAMAVNDEGKGDVTSTRIVWTAEEGLSDTASPVTDGSFFLHANSSGEVTCYRVPFSDEPAREPDRPLWSHTFEGSAFWASPVLARDLVYLFDDRGRSFVVPLAEQFSVKAQGALGEGVFASPAFADSSIYVRTENHLFCIRKAPQ